MSEESNDLQKSGVYGVVTLLDTEHRAVIEALWHDLEREFEIPHLYEEPIAHFSYHVSERYDLDRLKPVISRFVKYKSSFKVRTEGLGVFNKSEPVVYIPVVRNPQLATFHRSMWELINPWSSEPLKYYHPDSWMPHITLVHGNIPLDRLPDVVRFLDRRDFNWNVTVSNISIICSVCSEVEEGNIFRLSTAE